MEQEIGPRPVHPAIVIIVTLVAVMLGFQVIGPMIGFFVALPLYPGSLMEMTESLKAPMKDPDMKNTLYLMQGFGTLFGLILVPLYVLAKLHRSASALFKGQMYIQPLVMVVGIVMIFMMVNSVFIEWNQNITLPEGIEKWARSTEEQLAELTRYLTKFDSGAQVALALVVIAVLPAIGEELVFRGIIQREFYRGTNNIHVAIWVSAAIFSAIHIQFYGFVPRMLLGALFGYLYYWSGNLWMPILAHFINNGFTVVAMYLYQRGTVEMDIEDAKAAPWSAVLTSAVITVALLYLFKKFYEKRRPVDFADNTNSDNATLIP
jgi:hypothetical protein